MRVLLANSNCKVGGVSTFLLSLRTELLARGHECTLFFFEGGNMEPLLPPDAETRFGSLADCMRLVAERRIDVVHANNVDWPTGISAVRRLGAKLVLTAHKVREPAWTYGWHAGNCDAFVTVSGWIREELQPFSDIAIQAIPNGIDTRRFAPESEPAHDAGPPIVAWVGRGSAPRKRLERFAALAPALAAMGYRIWVIDQQGPTQFAAAHPDAARQLAAAAELWRSASFDDMPGIYRAIAATRGCLVSTASMEGLPLALLEAQACGCLVIGADVKGVRECVLPDYGGTLYREDATADEVVTRIRQLLAGDVKRLQAAAASHVRDQFSLAAMTDRYLALYTAKAVARRPRPLRLRLRRTPLLDWRGYVDERLGVGYAQYEASRQLNRPGDERLASAAAAEGLVTAPTMYLHPRRFTHLLKHL
jgi:glycosyltransferase involved in cell wall biosynthesis